MFLCEVGGFPEIGALKFRALDVGVLQIRHPEIRAAQVSQTQICFHEIGNAEFRFLHVGALEIGAMQIRFLKDRIPKVRPLSFLTIRFHPLLMGRENFFQFHELCPYKVGGKRRNP